MLLDTFDIHGNKTDSVIVERDLVQSQQDLIDGFNSFSYDQLSIAGLFETGSLDVEKILKFTGIPQTLSGAGAVNLTTAITWIVTTGANALTLADGKEGQIKYIVMKTDSGAGTLTPTNLGNGTTITFDDVGDCCMLLFTNGQWHFCGGTATLGA